MKLVTVERESWKTHFEQISNTQGEVNPQVWNNIGPAQDKDYSWMDATPSDIELDSCVRRMKNNRQPGEDAMMAEAVKYGGPLLRAEIYKVVKEMWNKARDSEDQHEAEDWPDEWRIGITVPLWKKKGSRTDKNTWRGITLLSIGSKLIARVVSARAQKWSEAFICEEQSGFRRGRGTDDASQIVRRMVEEATRGKQEAWIEMAFMDIEKAYPRVCRSALWTLMGRGGCTQGFVRICKALHEHTAYRVRIYEGFSSEWVPKRGLREGCPSSPPLFNVYHDGVLEDYRLRRKRKAEELGLTPGLPWTYCMNGRLQQRAEKGAISTEMTERPVPSAASATRL